MKRTYKVVWIMILTICISVMGCGKKTEMREKEGQIVIGIGSETGGLDPAGNIALTYLTYSVTALDELLTYDESGEIEYRAAVSYEVNDDFTEWTFRLREDARWSDGSAVTAHDFVNTIRRALDPKSGSGYANYLFPIQNAEQIYNGEKNPDTLGVRVPDDFTLQFLLEDPCVYFLQLLRLPVYTPSHAGYAKETGSGWDKHPKTSLSNGPYYLAEYVPEQYFTLKRNPFYWNQEPIKTETLVFRFFSDQQSLQSAYETGEVDIATGLPSAAAELYKGKPDLYLTNSIATRYIYPNLSVEPLNDVRVRRAINLAIDREALCKMAGQEAEPTVNFIAKYMKNSSTGNYYSEETKPPFEENVEEARRLLAEAGYPDGEGFPQLVYKYPAIELDADTAQVIQEQLKQNLNISIRLQSQELQTNYSDRRAGAFDLCRMNWTADFADPYTYLSMLLSNGTYNCSGIQDPTYDALVRASDQEPDPEKRTALIHEAEQWAVGEQFYVIPLFSVKICNLVNPKIAQLQTVSATGAFEYRYVEWEE